MLMSYVDDGAYYCKGTFQVFADALADVIRESGGDVLLRTEVEKVDRRRVPAVSAALR